MADGSGAGQARAGQVAVVTGGSAGLGLAIAEALALAGSAVVLASRSAARCERAAALLSARTGGTVAGRACDVTDERAVADLFDGVLAAELAGAALLLTDPGSAYLTGVVLPVDGGWTAH